MEKFINILSKVLATICLGCIGYAIIYGIYKLIETL